MKNESNKQFVSVGEASEIFGVSAKTIRRWCDNQNVKHIITPTGQRRIDINSKSIRNSTNRKDNPEESCNIFKKDICYCRVSTYKQKDDLERQISYMVNKFPGCTIIKDIGSGINFKRKGLLSILEQAEKGYLRSLTVTSKDRLCRFGFELIEWFLRRNNVEILVLNKEDSSPEQELTRDILTIMQVFNSRWNGKRRYSLIKNNEMQENKIEDSLSSEKNI